MDKNQKLDAIVNQLVGATDPDEVKSTYKAWADTYDGDLDSFGYVAPRIGVALLSRQLSDNNASIHDAGCGTGLVGSLLNQQGFQLSTSMLEKAALTGHYSDLQTIDFSGPVDIPSDSYDAVISIGVYTKRFDKHFIPEMVRIIRPAGYFVFSCREQYFEEVSRAASMLLQSNTITRVLIEHDDYMKGQNASAYYFCIEK